LNKPQIHILFIFFIFTILAHSSERVSKIGYLSEVYSDLKYKNSRIALKIWIEDISKDAGINIDLLTYNKYTELVDDYTKGKIQILALNPYFYLLDTDKINDSTRVIWNLQKDTEKVLQKIYLVVNKESNINSFPDLINKKILINKNNYIGKIFLEKLYFENLKNNSTDFMSKVDLLEKGTVLLKTFFGKYDACIIDSYEYDVMMELNPALSKKLKILESSDYILNNHMILFNKNNHPKNMEIYNNTLNRFLKDTRKNHLFDLIKINKIRVLDPSDLDKLKKVFSEYKKLKKKYN